jgi:AcrR family transcriptional regulator
MSRDRLRSRFPGRIREAVKDAALRQLEEGGPQALSINAIGKQLGVSGPALYRYYRGRDDLLTDLLLDAYADLAAALETATAPAPGQNPQQRLQAFAQAYREWALAQPHRYRLLFRPPLPGYDAHADILVAAAQRAMEILLGILAELPTPPTAGRAAGPPAAALAPWVRSRGLTDSAAPYGLQGIVIWARLHGLATLEIDGNYTSIDLDPAPLYASEVADAPLAYPSGI